MHVGIFSLSVWGSETGVAYLLYVAVHTKALLQFENEGQWKSYLFQTVNNIEGKYVTFENS